MICWKVVAEPQQLMWPTEVSFLITYDFPKDLSRISVCDILQYSPQRIIAKVIKEKKPLMLGKIEIRDKYAIWEFFDDIVPYSVFEVIMYTDRFHINFLDNF